MSWISSEAPRALGLLALAALISACEGPPPREEHHESEGRNAGAHEEHIQLSPEAIEASGITLGTVERRVLVGGAALPAELNFDPLSTAHVAPLAAGRFQRIAVALGDGVEEGQLLATVLSGAASAAGSRLTEVRARLAAAENTVARQRELVEHGIGAERALIDAEAEAAGLRAEADSLSRQLGVLGSSRGGLLRLVAPIAGVVTSVHATPGESANPDEAAFTIADPGAISAYAQVPELAVPRVREGLHTIFRPHAFPDLALGGTIQYIAPAIDPDTRSLSVRIALNELDPRLRSGMFGSVEVVGEGLRSLAVPTRAVVTFRGSTTVFVPGEDEGAFEAMRIRIGRRAGGFYEVLSGLDEGDAVVDSGAFVLKSALSSDQLAEHEH